MEELDLREELAGLRADLRREAGATRRMIWRTGLVGSSIVGGCVLLQQYLSSLLVGVTLAAILIGLGFYLSRRLGRRSEARASAKVPKTTAITVEL